LNTSIFEGAEKPSKKGSNGLKGFPIYQISPYLFFPKGPRLSDLEAPVPADILLSFLSVYHCIKIAASLSMVHMPISNGITFDIFDIADGGAIIMTFKFIIGN